MKKGEVHSSAKARGAGYVEGILGAVADILEPDPKYEVPLEAVLGQRLQYLIVEGEEEGGEAMTFLKRESLAGGVSFPREFRRSALEIESLMGKESPFHFPIS